MKREEANHQHETAMIICDLAMAMERRGHPIYARRLFQDAASFESQAASHVGDMQPSRSVLYRSAACLFEKGGMTDCAQLCCSLGLKGDPPAEIATEIREVIARLDAATHPEG